MARASRGLAPLVGAARSVLGVGRMVVGLEILREAVLSGRLAGGRRPVVVRFAGRARIAGDLSFLFDGRPAHGPEREERCFEGRLLGYALRPACATPADIHLEDALLSVTTRGRDITILAPYLTASLCLKGSLKEQIDGVRSTDLRRTLRRADERGLSFRQTRDSNDVARFYDEMYKALAVARFGPEASLVTRDEVQHVIEQRGTLLLMEDGGRALGGALLYRSRYTPQTLFWWKAGLVDAGRETEDNLRALETGVLRHAIASGLPLLNVGLARALPTDGIFIHKRRLGCDFAPMPGSPMFRMRLAVEGRADFLATCPLIVKHGGRLEAWHGLVSAETPAVKALGQRLSDGMFPGLSALRVFVPAGSAEDVRSALTASGRRFDRLILES
jgi:hypothetical protein